MIKTIHLLAGSAPIVGPSPLRSNTLAPESPSFDAIVARSVALHQEFPASAPSPRSLEGYLMAMARSDARVTLAQRLVRQDRALQATEVYRAILADEISSNGQPSPITLCETGIAFCQAGQYSEAVEAMEWAIRLKEQAAPGAS